jgi:hypothetical protein
MKSENNFDSQREEYNDVFDRIDKDISNFGNMLDTLGKNIDKNTESINNLLNFIMNK